MTCTCNRSLHIKTPPLSFSFPILFFILIHFPHSLSLTSFSLSSSSPPSSRSDSRIHTGVFWSTAYFFSVGEVLYASVEPPFLRSDCFSCSWLEIRAKHRRNWLRFLIRRCSTSQFQVSPYLAGFVSCLWDFVIVLIFLVAGKEKPCGKSCGVVFFGCLLFFFFRFCDLENKNA